MPRPTDLPESVHRSAAGNGPARSTVGSGRGPASTPAPGSDAVVLPSAPAFLCDASGRILRINSALLRMLGRDSRQPGACDGIGGQPVQQFVVGPDNDARLVRPDGALVRIRVVRWTLPPAAGRPELHAVMLVDVSDAAPAVAQRDDKDRQITALRRLAKAGTWTYDLRTGSLQRDPSLVELYREAGISPEARAGGAVELEQVAVLCGLLRNDPMKAEAGHHVEFRAGSPERVFSCHARVAPGAPVRLVGTVQDVTEHRTVEHRVGLATQRYLDLVAISPVGVGVFNRDGRLVDANPALCAMLGTPADGLRGVSARALTVEPDPAHGAGTGELAWLRVVPPGARHGYRVAQCAIRRADGTSLWCELSITVSVGDDGRAFWLVVFTDIGEKRRAADVLRIAGTHDELTRLANRSSIAARIGRLLAGPDRHRMGVLCCDLDDFKRVNSGLGHGAGDQVLIMLAARLQRELPIGCSPARLSGDEFVVVCDDIDAVGGVNRLAETVSALLQAPLQVDGQPVRVTASIGAALARDLPITGDLPGLAGASPGGEDLLRLVEAAMYDAKQRGVGELSFVTTDSAAAAGHQLRLEDELREALASDELVLHYQPVVGPDGVVRSAEALIRWPHPERGMLFPDTFIPVAERGGLMRELDRWVLRTATREAAGWPSHGRRPVGVAVNLAGLLPGDRDFLPTVRAALADSGLAGDRLVLELVETSLVSLPEQTLAAMDELGALGVRFAVDDFGTGYSSLARVKELPAQIVKVDRTFIREISTDPADFAVARAVVQMASAMGRYCVAEGVETAEQFHLLRELGVDAFQGWLFAKALEPTEVRAVLAGGPYPVPDGNPVPAPDLMATQAVRQARRGA